MFLVKRNRVQHHPPIDDKQNILPPYVKKITFYIPGTYIDPICVTTWGIHNKLNTQGMTANHCPDTAFFNKYNNVCGQASHPVVFRAEHTTVLSVWETRVRNACERFITITAIAPGHSLMTSVIMFHKPVSFKIMAWLNNNDNNDWCDSIWMIYKLPDIEC